MEYIVKFDWDGEAGVWIATSKDIPGLVLESGSFDALLERVRFAAPELLALNQVENPFDHEVFLKIQEAEREVELTGQLYSPEEVLEAAQEAIQRNVT